MCSSALQIKRGPSPKILVSRGGFKSLVGMFRCGVWGSSQQPHGSQRALQQKPGTTGASLWVSNDQLNQKQKETSNKPAVFWTSKFEAEIATYRNTEIPVKKNKMHRACCAIHSDTYSPWPLAKVQKSIQDPIEPCHAIPMYRSCFTLLKVKIYSKRVFESCASDSNSAC